jgi:hypothetical protein
MWRLALAALLAGALTVTGCGGDDSSSKDPVSQVPENGGLRDSVREAQSVDASRFPPAKGKTLQQIAQEVKGGGSVEAGLATSNFTVGRDRLAFGVIDQQGQFVYGPTRPRRARSPRRRTCS